MLTGNIESNVYLRSALWSWWRCSCPDDPVLTDQCWVERRAQWSYSPDATHSRCLQAGARHYNVITNIVSTSPGETTTNHLSNNFKYLLISREGQPHYLEVWCQLLLVDDQLKSLIPVWWFCGLLKPVNNYIKTYIHLARYSDQFEVWWCNCLRFVGD